jgi:hypothetical protein
MAIAASWNSGGAEFDLVSSFFDLVVIPNPSAVRRCEQFRIRSQLGIDPKKPSKLVRHSALGCLGCCTRLQSDAEGARGIGLGATSGRARVE